MKNKKTVILKGNIVEILDDTFVTNMEDMANGLINIIEFKNEIVTKQELIKEGAFCTLEFNKDKFEFSINEYIWKSEYEEEVQKLLKELFPCNM